ncbi:MAG: transporter substrate-binding domain-containing protein [Gemmatimonadales bacterium]|nr:MAG: transporter substrate-binding domain-containing protein [Gemmatimonadales bacterium]
MDRTATPLPADAVPALAPRQRCCWAYEKCMVPSLSAGPRVLDDTFCCGVEPMDHPCRTRKRPQGLVAGLTRLISPVAVLAALLASTTAGRAEAGRVMTHSTGDAVFLDQNGELRGVEQGGRRAMYVELVREILKSLGDPRGIEVVPLKRALFRLEHEPGQVLFNLNRTQERENSFKWAGPIHATSSYFYENSERPAGIKSLDDAMKVGAICVLRENVHHKFLSSSGFKNLKPVDSYASCIKMLALGRVDLAPLSTLSSANTDEQRLLRSTGVMIMDSQGYIAFSKETPDAEVQRWQDALDGIIASGRYDDIAGKYLGPSP